MDVHMTGFLEFRLMRFWGEHLSWFQLHGFSGHGLKISAYTHSHRHRSLWFNLSKLKD